MHAIGGHGRPEDLLKPCWTCHWFGYMHSADSSFCVNPASCCNRSQAPRGCSQWMRETGTDDIDPTAWRPRPINPSSALAQQCLDERLRLEKIYAHGERAYLLIRRDVVWGIYVTVTDRSGLLGVMAGSALPHHLAAAMEIVERLGVNAAIRAGRL
ncbi:UNVERIFIED_ORG: hypothetical protein LHJ69_12965 [Shinella sp. XGS7]|nr:hypothetical protein [Shinella sp. XGS7]